MTLNTYSPSLRIGYGIEHAQCVPPSEYSEPGFITESYQTLHPISSEDLISLKYESEYPSVILRDAALNSLQTEYFSVKQEVVSPDNMCVGRISRGDGSLLLHTHVQSCAAEAVLWMLHVTRLVSVSFVLTVQCVGVKGI